MSRHKHIHSTLIDQIGKQKVREHFGLSPQALHAWRLRGIPAMKRIAFARLCADHCVPTPEGFFAPLEINDRADAA